MTQQLGRGLSALLGDISETSSNTLAIEDISPSSFQPRQIFNEEALNALASSISQKGVLQPLLVRVKAEGGGYEIVAGERRWRAAQKANLTHVPVVIIECSDEEGLEIALIENLQRENLNPLEEAESIQKLMSLYDKTQEATAQILGKSRSYIANALRLLTLPESVKDYVRSGQISAGHARVLVGNPDAYAIAQKIIDEKLTVRDVENMARQYRNRPARTTGEPSLSEGQLIAQELSKAIGLKVSIHVKSSGIGTLSIFFDDFVQLDDLVTRLKI